MRCHCQVHIYYLERGKHQPIISVYFYPDSPSNIYIEADVFSVLEIGWRVTVVLNPTIYAHGAVSDLKSMQPDTFFE